MALVSTIAPRQTEESDGSEFSPEGDAGAGDASEDSWSEVHCPDPTERREGERGGGGGRLSS